MPVSRRTAMQGLITGGLAAASTACVQQPGQQQQQAAAISSKAAQQSLVAAIPDVVDTPVFNKARAVDVLSEARVDLLLCSDPVNVFYLTNHRVVTNALGMDGLTFASFESSGRSAPALITGAFSYYLASDRKTIPKHVQLKLFSSPAEPELYAALTDPKAIVSAPASGGYMTPLFDRHPLTSFERERRDQLKAAAAETVATSDGALLKALFDSDLPNKTVAVDDPKLIPLLESSGLGLKIVDGEQLLRRIRLQKTEAELVYARYIAAANAAAGLAAAKTVTAGANLQELRVEFGKACGERLITPVYILIDGVYAPLVQETIKPGRAFLIDCVSHFEGYHGDYGRTVCVGEPNGQMQQVVDALSFVWDRVLPELKVGVLYSDIWALGEKLFAETKVDAGLILGPHAVGLHHTDEPGGKPFAPFEKQDLKLEENMVLSVDMPVVGSGLGGTAHLEDLVLIGKDGPELMNPTTDRFVVV